MAVRTVVASGNWSNPAVWQGGILPQAGDDVVHGAGYTVVLDITPPPLGDYTLDGLLLLQSAGGVNLTVASLSGSGGVDLQALPSPDGAEVLPCVLSASGGVLDFRNLSSLFQYYTSIFHRLLHGFTWWGWDYMDFTSLAPFVLPQIASVNTSGSDLLLGVTTNAGTPARRFLELSVGKTVTLLLPLRDVADTSVVRLSPVSASISSTTSLTVSGSGGLAERVPMDAYIAPVEHVALCPIVFRSAVLPAGVSLRGICFSDGCTASGVVNAELCCVRSALDISCDSHLYITAHRVMLRQTYMEIYGKCFWAAEG